MRLLIVGSENPSSIENFYVNYLLAEGVEVRRFSAQNLFFNYYYKGLFNKLCFRLGVSGIYSAINSEFKKCAAAFNPDIIWVFKGMEIFPESLNWAKRRGAKLVNFNGDNPFFFSGSGSGNSNVTLSIPLYDLHLTYDTSVKVEFDRRKVRSFLLPFGFDVNDKTLELCSKEEEILKVCFVGNPDRERGSFIDRLGDQNVPVTVYGNAWSKFLRHPKILINPPVYGEDQWKVLRRYRVQLNLMRPHNPNSHNMRTFEVPGVGGIMLAPDTADHRSFFKDGKEAFFFGTFEDCVSQVEKILALPTADANLVRTAARERSIAGGYRYKDRAKQALKILNTLLP